MANKKENIKNLVKRMFLSISMMTFFVSAGVDNASAMEQNSIFGEAHKRKSDNSQQNTAPISAPMAITLAANSSRQNITPVFAPVSATPTKQLNSNYGRDESVLEFEQNINKEVVSKILDDTKKKSGKDSDSSAVVPELDEMLQRIGLDEKRTVPSSDLEYSAFVEEYLNASPDTLIYSSTFWDVVKRSVIDLRLSVLTKEKIDLWFENQSCFIKRVVSDKHYFFVSEVIEKFFNAWKDGFLDLQNKKLATQLQPEQFCIELLQEYLNKLIEIANSKKIRIEWTF